MPLNLKRITVIAAGLASAITAMCAPAQAAATAGPASIRLEYDLKSLMDEPSIKTPTAAKPATASELAHYRIIITDPAFTGVDVVAQNRIMTTCQNEGTKLYTLNKPANGQAVIDCITAIPHQLAVLLHIPITDDPIIAKRLTEASNLNSDLELLPVEEFEAKTSSATGATIIVGSYKSSGSEGDAVHSVAKRSDFFSGATEAACRKKIRNLRDILRRKCPPDEISLTRASISAWHNFIAEMPVKSMAIKNVNLIAYKLIKPKLIFDPLEMAQNFGWPLGKPPAHASGRKGRHHFYKKPKKVKSGSVVRKALARPAVKSLLLKKPKPLPPKVVPGTAHPLHMAARQ